MSIAAKKYLKLITNQVPCIYHKDMHFSSKPFHKMIAFNTNI